MNTELQNLCSSVRQLCEVWNLKECHRLIGSAMGEYPDAAEPHNLLGIILEKEGNHVSAMKHFRAAWALDPTYLPAHQNLNTFGTFCACGSFAFDESDVVPEPLAPGAFVRKEGRLQWEVSRKKIEYDKNGIGRVIRRREP